MFAKSHLPTMNPASLKKKPFSASTKRTKRDPESRKSQSRNCTTARTMHTRGFRFWGGSGSNLLPFTLWRNEGMILPTFGFLSRSSHPNKPEP